LEVVEMTLSISSPAFQDGERIPAKYTCEGQNVSPQLEGSGVPEKAQSLALIMDDPDAPGGTFTHWVIFNTPPDSLTSPEAVPTEPQLSCGTQQGINDFGTIGYGGPCPPPGRPHRYRFTLYALDQPLDLKAGASKEQLLGAMEGHIIEQARLTGTYQR
jgi:Raf kinase inhibitor-like YbhB/YbcL family protein